MPGQTVIDIFDERVAESADRTALRYKADGRWQELSWSAWSRASLKYAAGLVALGVRAGDRVALMSRTRLDWVVADIGILYAGAITVPVHHTSLPRQCAAIVRSTGANVIIVEDPHQLQKVLAARSELPELRHIIYLDELAELDVPDRQGRTLLRLDDLGPEIRKDKTLVSVSRLGELGSEALGRDPNAVLEQRRCVEPGSVASIVFTSGTSGRPRGVVLTHANMVASINANHLAVPLGPTDEQLLALPLSFVFARINYLTAVRAGTMTAFCTGTDRFIEELQQVRPTFFTAVPHVFERILNSFRSRMLAETRGPARGFVERSFRLADIRVETQAAAKAPPLYVRAELALADSTVFARFRSLMGGRIRFAFCGGAALPAHVSRFFQGVGIEILEGYGLTETCSAICVNRPGATRIGTVGVAMNGIAIRIADDGEILVQAPQVMQGYLDEPDVTAEVLRDGWLHTGDIGELDGDYLRITDRKKDMIVTATGRSIAPAPLEARLQTLPWIDRAVVYGEGRKYLTALLTLRMEPVVTWARQNGLSDIAKSELPRNPRVYDLVRQHVEELNKDLSSAESIRRFAILDEDFRPDSGELTASMKTRRHFIAQKYKGVIEGLYDESLAMKG
ncbi:MAG: AMP-dependent synthetase/ligase [Myxococcales bacterium]|nr:AMP-dependent synthetase/ligase [Myxococcales bacterium]